MIYRIVKYGDPVLETPAQDVTEFNTQELRQLVDDMFETMYAAKGVGLAAPQIGLAKRLAVIDCSVGENPTEKVVLINPELITSDGSQTDEEGCLSLPGFREQVTRARSVVFRTRTWEGGTMEIPGQELLARAMLHETDHLNGVLFIMHISPLKRDLIRRRIRKLMKAGEWN